MPKDFFLFALAQGVSVHPGWAEKNFQVLGKAFEVVRQVAAGDVAFSKKDAFLVVMGAVPKLSDSKLKGPAGEALSTIAEIVGPQFICTQVHKQAASQKNPKVRQRDLVCCKCAHAW